MEKETIEHIINVLRQGTLTWYVRSRVLNRHRERRPIGNYKDKKRKDEIKYKWFYPCEGCWEYFGSSDVLQVDHIVEIGGFESVCESNWHTFVTKMFCDESNLQALCKVCHDRKTAFYAGARSFERKRVFEEYDDGL